jgi:hypothetical protein
VKKTRQNNQLEQGSDRIGTDMIRISRGAAKDGNP